jgi:hypothetical protein
MDLSAGPNSELLPSYSHITGYYPPFFSELPLETWTDVFGYLPRSQLVTFFPHIDDRQFSRVLQFFLHKCGQITLGRLHIRTSSNGNGPVVVLQNNRELPLAEGPIPPNVVNFKEIRIRFAYNIFFEKTTSCVSQSAHFFLPSWSQPYSKFNTVFPLI